MTPWARYRQIAFGVLRWTPAAYREATIRDLFDGLAGWQEAHGVKKQTPMSRERLDELKARYGN